MVANGKNCPGTDVAVSHAQQATTGAADTHVHDGTLTPGLSRSVQRSTARCQRVLYFCRVCHGVWLVSYKLHHAQKGVLMERARNRGPVWA